MCQRPCFIHQLRQAHHTFSHYAVGLLGKWNLTVPREVVGNAEVILLLLCRDAKHAKYGRGREKATLFSSNITSTNMLLILVKGHT